jgi:Peptidase M76 family
LIEITKKSQMQQQQQQQQQHEDQKRCDSYVQKGLTSNTTIQFLLERLEAMGCTPPAGFIQCLDCEGKPVSGGFGMLQEEEVVPSSSSSSSQQPDSVNNKKDDTTATANDVNNYTLQQQHKRRRPDCTKSREEILDQFQRDKDGTTRLRLVPEIYLCQEHVSGPKHAQTILTHELIHAIDMCRTKMDPLRNCMQLACTEVRAENLSGECNPSWEFLRGTLTNPKQLWSNGGHQRSCVKRRAVDSVRGNPTCTNQAELYVDAVMERCYADTFPFERHPNQR